MTPDLGPLRSALGRRGGGPFLMLNAQSDEPSGFLAVGARRSLTLRSPHPDGLDALEDFITRSSTRTFGWISYDPAVHALGALDGKDQLHVNDPQDVKDVKDPLDGLPPAPIEFPAIHWMEPEVLLKFEGLGATARIETLAGGPSPWAELARQAILNPIAGPNRPAAGLESTLETGPPTRFHLNRAQYARAFEGVQGNIQRGDVYELNLCNTQVGRTPVNEGRTFAAMMATTRPPHGAWIGFNDKAVLSASPERFLGRRGDQLISQPIKGTAPRWEDPEKDRIAAERLQSDPKERSENIMITDLVRNDLSRIAQPSTVEVTELCGIHSFQNVHQMVSTICCTVKPEMGLASILRATFPMGSMTGAPKARAMELISSYEPGQRGLYSGALGWADPGGDFDLSVVIRTALVDHRNQTFAVQTGGAITVAARCESEWEETLLKARTLLEALAP